MTASNSLQTARELEALYRSDRKSAGAVVGYVGPGGAPLGIPGDAQSAWLKVPPFTESVKLWLEPSALPGGALPVADYVVTPEIDVAAVRLLTVYIKLVWTDVAEDTAQLSIIPEHQAADSQYGEEWYTTGVVNPTITPIDPTGTAFGDGTGSRTWFPAELRTPVFTTAPRTVLSKLVFDVADASRFRLQVLQNVAAQTESTLELKYARSQ